MSEKENTKKELLIIDDDAFLVDLYSIKFKEAGYDVTALLSAEEALEKLREGYAPSIILLDIIMPAVDGIKFLQIMRSEGLAREAIVIALSNTDEARTLEEAKKLGVRGYIIKANNLPSEVLTQVEALVSSSHHRF